MATDTCDHTGGIGYVCNHYPVGTAMHTVHRFTCIKCRTEARITDSVDTNTADETTG